MPSEALDFKGLFLYLVIWLFFPIFVFNPHVLKKIFEYIFKQYPPFTDIYNDTLPKLLGLVGNSLVGVGFILFGIIAILYAGKKGDVVAAQRRKRLCKMTGFCFLSCGCSRVVTALAIWHNYANLNGILTCLTGILTLITLIFIPSLIKEVKDAISIKHVRDSLEKIYNQLENVKLIENNITESNK